MKPTVMYVLTSSVRGGVEEHVLSLVKGLDRRRFEVALVCPPALLDALGADLDGVSVERIPIALDGPIRVGHLREVMRLYRVFRRRRPAIVHAHLLRATWIGVVTAWLARVPVRIETFHGREALREGSGRLKRSFVIDRLVHRLTTRVIAVSEASKRHLVEAKGFDGGKITVVYNGRDLTTYTPETPAARREVRAELGIAEDAPVLGVVARLDYQKGHSFLLAAMPEILARVPGARLLLVGDGELRGDLEAQGRVLEVTDRVIFAGFRTDIARLIGAMDIVVLPSLFEGLPLTVIEASAMGRPMVATAVDGTPEAVLDGVTGLLVPPADPGGLAKAILKLLHDPGLARRLGEAGARHVAARFDLRQQIAATERVYEACR